MSDMHVQKLAVVLFAYNEIGNLLRLLRRIDDVLSRDVKIASVQYAICVQGIDGTLAEAEKFAREVEDRVSVRIEHFPQPLGVYGAANQALSLVDGDPDAYLMMDCDLNHQPEELPRFFSALDCNCVVIGSRFCQGGRIVGMPLWKKCLSTIFNSVASTFLKMPVLDKTSGYRLICGRGITTIAREVQGRGFDFYIEFLLRMSMAGLKIKEVPICFHVRTEGVSKMRFARTVADYASLLLRLSGVLRSRASSSPQQFPDGQTRHD
jgi:dolichol-phosphate mannosyltransferase